MADYKNIPTTDEQIRELNPWKGLFVNPNHSVLYDDNAQWLLKCDAGIINEYNEKNRGTDYEFKLGMRPEQFNGNPLTSKVVILSLNPGYIYRVNNLYARLLQNVQPIAEAVMQHKDEQLNLTAKSFFCKRNQNNTNGVLSYRDAHCALDDWYWYDIFNKFRDDAGLPKEDDTDDVIFNNVALVQYVGYLSKSWKALPRILPSQEFTRTLIHYLALRKKNVLFVVSRSKKEWKELIGDEIWDMLKSENRLVLRATFENKKGITQTIRTQYFTPTSFEGDGFERIIEKLRT